MAPSHIDHLAVAKECLAIAESGDPKREAYMRAAEAIASHIDETGDSQRAVAAYCNTHASTIDKVLRWRRAGYPEGTTPFTMADPSGSKPTDRAAISHTRKVLREAPVEQIERLIADLPAERRRHLAEATGDAAVREAYDKVANRDIAARYGRTESDLVESQHRAEERQRERDNDATRLWRAIARNLSRAMHNLRIAGGEMGNPVADGFDEEQRETLFLYLDRIDELASALRAAMEAGEALTDEAIAEFMQGLEGQL